MLRHVILAATATLALTACSKSETGPAATGSADTAVSEAAELPAAARADNNTKSLPALDNIPFTLPQLAYVYDYRWRLPASDIGPLQRRHASQCEQQGPVICQILGMTKTGETEGEVAGKLEMAVATRQARAFGALLEDEAQDVGAKQIAADLTSEELSKQLVDTEARVKARTQLRDRLAEVLRTRKGTVEELVEAERSVAAVNEEIDQAKSWLREMEGRVAYSRITVHYETGTAATRDFLAPVSGALGSLGSIFGYLAALLILAGAVVLPLGGVWWGSRILRRRLAPTAPVSPDAT